MASETGRVEGTRRRGLCESDGSRQSRGGEEESRRVGGEEERRRTWTRSGESQGSAHDLIL
jgi:hypothetical protein